MYNATSHTLEYVSISQILTKLYELKIKVPTDSIVRKYIQKNSDNDIALFFGKNIRNGIQKIKKMLSRVDNKIPLYDIYTENLYLVDRGNIYDKIMSEYYRFPTKKLLDTLRERKDELEVEIMNLKTDADIIEKELVKKLDIHSINKETYQTFQYGKLLIRTHRKIELCLDFMDSFDLSILFNTYINTLYTYSNQLGKNITLCKRPSFAYQFKHITPYYTRSEIINIALNMGIIKDDSTYYDDEKIRNLCKVIRDNDINSKIILEHQIHIIKNKMIGLVQYYSLQGSYFMNQYLRGQTNYNYKNEYLESLIAPMWKLILNAPLFDKQYIVYRFIQTDEFISNLKVGDEYIERGFMSTTRNPFYQNDAYKFGWILLKIRLPANVKGCALCIEAISLFQKEEEIILPPNTKFKLLRKDDKSIYYHTDKSISKKVRTLYEFEAVGISDVTFIDRPIYSEKETPIDFLKIDKVESLTIEEKIHKFINKYVNPMSQFTAIIGDKNFIVKSEWYDGSSVYKNYYASLSKNGYSLYSVYNNHLIFIIEIGEQYNVPFMYVNYNIKYSTFDRDSVIGSENFMNFISSIAYYFDIPTVVLYADYVSCDYLGSIDEEHKFIKFYGGTYCVDFYDYLKHGTKKYSDINVLNIELIPKFRYHQLDVLKKTSPDTLLQKTDERKTDDRIYQIYIKTYKDFISDINNNLANFYVWIVENHCFMLNELLDKFNKIPQYVNDNPFQNDYYIFNAVAYLYNRGKISSIPFAVNNISIENISFKTKSNSMNRYRIVEENRRR